ncbi:Por secretion system C-terminal sorting domain-containing protein [Hymenobacter daecheongensis DSM 21074]|uniref:Por secretion system C-terminal sorting domain-containing protein n=1 Tax=Hymenobacter daecheongensis DSM 21074 TaxID=1121955 RepID=A0A1M6LDR5_9BACT|nr:T9SS type A sorting domain-containing protein [Hymenobacter daecheongensis]SHJ69297.1 Por secretion system C-terminal sorting domain-containing protein [Hymenobacter daecheongensis DSM 21074]
MKKLLLPILLALATVSTVPQEAHAQSSCPSTPPAPVVVTGNITANTTWTRNNIYLLSGNVAVQAGATLTIEPGTIIKGEKSSKGTLIVARGARLEANGTASQPIVFTSNEAPGARRRGDWGGIIILGRSQENIAGDPAIEGVTGYNYGPGVGNAPVLNDNSGTLRYVRIEFPGVLISTNNEINGLTLGGVGSGTTIEYVQVSYSGDDSFEWFGGTVNAKYLVAMNALDDDFDTDAGFAGNVQYGLVLRDPSSADASQSNAFESDNDAQGTNAQPLTAPVFSNVTVILPPPAAGQSLNSLYRHAMHLRRNTSTSVFNSVFSGFPIGLYLQASNSPAPFPTPNTETNLNSGALVLRNNVLAGSTTPLQVQAGSTLDLAAYFNEASRGNTIYANSSSLGLNASNFNNVDPANANATINNVAPDYTLPAASPLVAGASFTDAKLAGSFFTTGIYRGAFGPAGTANWAQGWTNFNPQITCYNIPGQVLAAKPASADQVQGLSVAPNPTAGEALLSFELKRADAATVRIVDAVGRTVATLEAGRLVAGPQQLALPASLKNGVYVATVTTSETSQTVRFVVAK